MSKFTPGPWEVKDYVATCCKGQMALSCKEVWSGDRRICSIVNEANACLIAAVPELFELLKAAKCPCCDGSGGYYDNCGDPTQCQWCDETKQAIAKATG